MVQKEGRRRGRPRSYDPETALARARDAFWNTGYAATSLDELSAATGLNRPSLYGAFGDKKALYLKALERTRREMAAGLEAVLSAPGPLREALARVFEAAARIYLSGDAGQRGCFLIGTAVTESVADPDIRAAVAAGLGETDAAFAARFRQAQAAGELDAGLDPGALGQMASAVLHTLAVRARTGADAAELRRIGETGVRLICGQG